MKVVGRVFLALFVLSQSAIGWGAPPRPPGAPSPGQPRPPGAPSPGQPHPPGVPSPGHPNPPGGGGSTPSEPPAPSYDDGCTAGRREGERRGDSEGESAGRLEGRSAGDREGEVAAEQEARARSRRHGYDQGWSVGQQQGQAAGLNDGQRSGTNEGNSKGQAEGDSAGAQAGYDASYPGAYQDGYARGKATDAYARGLKDGRSEGTTEGMAAGKQAGDASGEAIALAQLHQGPLDEEKREMTSLRGQARYELLSAYDDGYRACYQSAYQSAYRSEYNRYYRNAYDSAYNSAYQSGVGRTYPDEVNAGVSQGRSAGYDSAYGPARDEAHRTAFSRAYQSSYDSAYRSGFARGQAEGRRKGEAMGYAQAVSDEYDRGHHQGYEETFQKNYDVAFGPSKEQAIARVNEHFRTHAVLEEGQFHWEDTSGDGVLVAGERIRFDFELKNFGFMASNPLKFEVSAEDGRDVDWILESSTVIPVEPLAKRKSLKVVGVMRLRVSPQALPNRPRVFSLKLTELGTQNVVVEKSFRLVSKDAYSVMMASAPKSVFAGETAKISFGGTFLGGKLPESAQLKLSSSLESVILDRRVCDIPALQPLKNYICEFQITVDAQTLFQEVELAAQVVQGDRVFAQGTFQLGRTGVRFRPQPGAKTLVLALPPVTDEYLSHEMLPTIASRPEVTDWVDAQREDSIDWSSTLKRYDRLLVVGKSPELKVAQALLGSIDLGAEVSFTDVELARSVQGQYLKFKKLTEPLAEWDAKAQLKTDPIARVSDLVVVGSRVGRVVQLGAQQGSSLTRSLQLTDSLSSGFEARFALLQALIAAKQTERAEELVNISVEEIRTEVLEYQGPTQGNFQRNDAETSTRLGQYVSAALAIQGPARTLLLRTWPELDRIRGNSGGFLSRRKKAVGWVLYPLNQAYWKEIGGQ